MANSKDIRSKFRLEFDAPGAEQTKKKVDKIRESLGKLGDGSKAVNANALSAVTHRNLKQMAHLQKQVGQLSGSFRSLNQAVQKLTASINQGAGTSRKGSGGGAAPPAAPGAGPGSGGGAAPPGPGGGGRRGGGGGGGQKKQKPAGSFFRGLIQGAGLGEFYPDQTKSGMMKQALGRMFGQMGAGAASMPFTGLAGLQQGLAGIPFVGGIAAGTFGAGQAASQQALAYQKSLLGLAPNLNLRGAQKARKAALAAPFVPPKRDTGRAASGYDQMLQNPELFRKTHLPKGRFGQDILSPEDVEIANMLERSAASREGRKPRLTTVGDQAREYRLAAGERAKSGDENLRKRFEDERPARAAGAAAKALGLGDLNSAAMKFGGMNMMEANDFAKGLLGRSGGRLDQMGKGFLGSAISAQTLFGAGGDITGAFQKGARRGGIVGGGSAENMLVDAIKSGMTAGMDNSEVRDFLASISQAQEQFMRTGIPVNPKSMAMMQGAVAGAGLGVGRGMFVGQQLTNRAQMISQKGPQTAADMLMLQKFGGFKGGSLEDLEGAMGKMENLKDMKPEDFLGFISSISKGSGGGTAGRFALRNVFGGMGASLGVDESKLLQKAADGGALNADEMKKVKAIQDEIAERSAEAQGLTGKRLRGAASGAVGTLAGGVRGQAGIENLNIAIGTKLLPTMQKFEKTAQKSVLALSKFEPTLNAIATGTLSIATKLPAIAASVQDIFDMILKFIGKTGGPGSGM